MPAGGGRHVLSDHVCDPPAPGPGDHCGGYVPSVFKADGSPGADLFGSDVRRVSAVCGGQYVGKGRGHDHESCGRWIFRNAHFQRHVDALYAAAYSGHLRSGAAGLSVFFPQGAFGADHRGPRSDCPCAV